MKKHIWLHDEVCYYDSYSPAAIIRNAKIWNIILLLAFCPKIKLKSGFRISCSVRKKLVEESTIIALTPNLLAIFAIFRLSEFKRCNSHVTAKKNSLVSNCSDPDYAQCFSCTTF